MDVTGTTILPGLTDAHGHLYGLGLSLDTVNLVGASTFDEVVARVKERAQRAQPGEWILGRGWDQNRWPDKQFPTAAPLDASGAIHWNPAAISGLGHSDVDFGVELLYPQVKLSSSLPAGPPGSGLPPVPLYGITRSDGGVFPLADVQVGDVENPDGHRRLTL